MPAHPAAIAAGPHALGHAPLARLSSVPPGLLDALTATQPLHPKQRALLAFLNQCRDPQSLHQTIPLSYATLHDGAGISIDHIRRNALPRLFRNGLLRVVSQTFSGTIYQLRFDYTTLHDVVTHLQHHAPDALPPPDAVPPLAETSPLAAMQAELTLLRQIHDQRHTLRREDFAARLTPDQVRWLIARAKQTIDTQDGIRFIKDRFPHYEAARLALLDEWMLRQQYGEQVPSAPPPTEGLPRCDY